eukprot:Gb_33590 [translate_table: standard]
MPRLSDRARDDLSNIGAWWFFKDHTVIRVEGVLTAPHKLPVHVPDRLVAFEVASQCLLGTWPALAKFGNEVDSMDLPGKAAGRMWDPFNRVRNHLAGLKDKMSQEYHHERDEREDGFYLNPISWEHVLQRMQEADDTRREREDADDTEEALTRNILRGLPTRDALIPDLPEATPVPPPVIHTPSQQVTPQKEASLPTHASTSVPWTLGIMVPPISDSAEKTLPGTLPALSPPIPGPPQEPKAENPPEHREESSVIPPELTRGIRVSSLISLRMPVCRSPALPIIPRPPYTSLIMQSSTARCEKPVLIPSDISGPAVAMPLPKLPEGGRSKWFAKQLAEAEATGGVVMKPPEVILEYDKATSSLKKITKRRVRTGSQVSTIQMEENVPSLTRKRKRGAQSKELGDEELAADPVSIVRSANRMTEEAVERMHLELVHGKDKVTAPPSMGVEITNSIRELYKSYTRAEEARAQGEETHQKIETSLGRLDEWDAKLATLGNAESELDANLGEFSGLFSRQLSSVEERGNQDVLEFVVQAAWKVERARCLKDTLDPVLAEHTQVVSRALARLQEPIVNTARIESDYDKYVASRGKDKAPPASGMPLNTFPHWHLRLFRIHVVSIATLLLPLTEILPASPPVPVDRSSNRLTRTPPCTMMKGTGGDAVRSFCFESIYDRRA